MKCRLNSMSYGLLGATALSVLMTATSALAQDGSQDGGQGLGDIVVTAERRPNVAQKTPIALSVYDKEALTTHGVSDLQSLARIAPDVNFGQITGSPTMTIRGISSRDTTEVGDPAVAINIDGFYSNRPYALRATLFDLERIEVLRGPQGTLNGRNAVGGAVNIITAKPTDKFEGAASFTYGNYDTLNADAFVNVPISDTLRVRVSAISRSHSGYRSTPPIADADDEDSKAGRVQILFEPSSRFKALLTAELVKVGGYGVATYSVPYVILPDGSVSHDRPPLPANGDSFVIPGPQRTDIVSKNGRWNFSYDADVVDITYLGGYSEIDYRQTLSNTGVRLISFDQHEKPHTWNHELRIASKPDLPLTWQAGFYFFEERSKLLTSNVIPTSFSAMAPISTFQFDLLARSKALYGQASLKLASDLKLTGGVRYNWDDKSLIGGTYIADRTVTPFTYSFSPRNNTGSWTKATYHAGLDWQAAPRNLIYAKFDTGYKPGGFTAAGNYDPEEVKAYEIGSKNRLLGGQLELNLSGFYMDYTNQQVSQNVAIAGGAGAILVQNAGSSEIYGVEVNSVWAVPHVATIDLAVQLLHAEYKNFVAAQGSVNVNYAGNTLPQAPRYTIGLGIERALDLPGGATLTARADTKIVGSQHFQFQNFASDYQEAFSKTNLFLTFKPSSGNWYLQGYLKNIENARVLTLAQEAGAYTSYRYAFDAPRTFGGTFGVKF